MTFNVQFSSVGSKQVEVGLDEPVLSKAILADVRAWAAVERGSRVGHCLLTRQLQRL